MSLDELYQTVILEHYRKPRNQGEMKDATVKVHGDNPMCGDEITLYLKLDADRKVEGISFTGQGCAISVASASMMTAKVKGKPVEEVEKLLQSFHDMIVGDPQPAELDPKLGEVKLLAGVRHFPPRVKCATLAWHALRQAIAGGQQTFTLEPDSPDL
ncbi:MAG: SUF system NifU family Fe-S cluster assembly protein [Verrucomicrobiae bacterium]|nr:SUF system NifU family Fe-S cluster assembly protein [Verrucomicrobiae bacterium]